MSFSRKSCLYRNCKKEPGSTLFKFPDDNERFEVWCLNAGLNLKGNVDITEQRFLCEKHFSSNYICTQSRRKMLVYTAVPEKWKENIDEEVKFRIVGTPPKRGKRCRQSSYSDHQLSKSPPTILNVRRSSSRLPALTHTLESDVEEHLTDDQNASSFSIAELNETNNEAIYEEIALPQSSRKYKFVVVKSKRKNESAGQVFEASPPQMMKFDEVDDTDISSSNLEAMDGKKEEEIILDASMQNDHLENYSEFIFNGERYVQMPQRVFEAEKEKIRKEGEKCKLLLRKLKSHLSKLDLD